MMFFIGKVPFVVPNIGKAIQVDQTGGVLKINEP